MISKSLYLPLLLASLLAACAKAPAPDAAAPAAVTTAPSVAPAVTVVAEEGDEELAIPDTADGIWQAIDKHSGELKSAIDSGALTTVHHHAFAIRDLVAALPAHSPELPPEEQAKLQGEVKFVATLADRLDQTGDAGDKAGAQENFEKLSAVLNGITRYK
jgi:hypothetical protein